jgi:ADP-heptose:LPS heptosyltransferase
MPFTTILYQWQYHTRQWYAGRVRSWWQRASNGPITSEAPRRALVVLTGLLGDTVMSTPVIVEVRRLWPEARITLLGNRQTCELLSACPLIDACLETPAVPFTLRKRRSVAELERWLKEQNFDVAIILLGDQFAQILADAQIPIRVGVRSHVLAPFLTTTYDIGSPKDWGPPERLGALRALGHNVRDVIPNLWVSDHARSAAQRRLIELGLPEGVPYAVVHPFGSTPAQWWPPDRTAELAEALCREYDLWTIIIGGPETCGTLGPTARNAIDTTGALTISKLMAVIENARLVISTDSGPFHIAGALRRPLVGLFRARRPEHSGRYPQARVVFGYHPSCAGRCDWNRCRTVPCREMNALSVCDVLDAVRSMMTRDPLGTL